MTNPKSLTLVYKYYFYNDATKIIYISDDFLQDQDLVYLGTSNNPNHVMAAGAFTQTAKISTGYTIREVVIL